MSQFEIDKQSGNKWRFTGNNFHEESGLDTAEMETFRKDPIASLAREICQNSIDAKKDDESFVRVEFQTFKVNRESILGIDRVQEEIASCKEYQANKKIIKNVESLEYMNNEIEKEEIECLRISDFNTKGLTGIGNYLDGDGTFHKLTRTSGNSDKQSGKGGSKGVGKYATFVVSKFNTVFYSTKNQDNEEGFLGISKLCSTIYDPETKERTEGTGYYGKNFQGEPILGEQLNIEPGYERKDSGTDIYILGFNSSESWKSEIITKILDSFMAAIIYDQLVVVVDDIKISRENIESVINNPTLLSTKSKYVKSIKSQYELLTDNNIKPHKIDMKSYGDAHVFLKAYNKDEAEMATQECTMIRYPYMKIKSLNNIAHVPFSAVCVIGDNKLNELLREIENPQHDSWDIHELDKKPLKKKEVSDLKKAFLNEIYNYIQDALAVPIDNVSDIEGASEFLPLGDSDTGDKSNGNEVINDVITVVPLSKTKHKDTRKQMENEDATGLEPTLITREPGEGSPVPDGTNSGGGGGLHDGSGETGYSTEDGNQEGLKTAPLSGVQYRMMCLNKNDGEYLISFTSPQSVSNCELSFKIVDDNNNKEKIDIKSANINGVDYVVKDGKVSNFDLISGEKYKVKINTDLRDYYCGEVSISYESR